MQRTTLAVSSSAEIISTGMWRRSGSCLSHSSTAGPSRSGIMTSSRTRSTGSRWRSASASRPPAAVSTRWPSRVSRRTSSSRFSSLSSTTRIVAAGRRGGGPALGLIRSARPRAPAGRAVGRRFGVHVPTRLAEPRHRAGDALGVAGDRPGRARAASCPQPVDRLAEAMERAGQGAGEAVEVHARRSRRESRRATPPRRRARRGPRRGPAGAPSPARPRRPRPRAASRCSRGCG